jgi:ubiquinone/menaquinone biosynthesis C-methylase UbiE/uncharacterized protein YbaR (Trm112 family)
MSRLTEQEFYRSLRCPACRGNVHLRTDAAELSCAACAFTFPIVDGIPVMFPCNVAVEMKALFTRYWDSEEKAYIYDTHVEGGGQIGATYNHESEMFALTRYYVPERLDLVLDAGCGNGRFLETLPPSATSVGIDASLNLLRIARQKKRGSFHVCCELEHLPFPDRFFGTVISCRVLQHLREQERAVHELVRVAREGGSIILELYNTWNLKTLYKNIRMSRYRKIFNWPFRKLFRSLSPFDDWGLGYDKYNGWFQVKRWLRKSGVREIRGRGVGFGYHKYLLDPFYIDPLVARHSPGLLRAYYRAAFAVERAIGQWIPFRYTMEKFVVHGTRFPLERGNEVAGAEERPALSA